VKEAVAGLASLLEKEGESETPTKEGEPSPLLKQNVRPRNNHNNGRSPHSRTLLVLCDKNAHHYYIPVHRLSDPQEAIRELAQRFGLNFFLVTVVDQSIENAGGETTNDATTAATSTANATPEVHVKKEDPNDPFSKANLSNKKNRRKEKKKKGDGEKKEGRPSLTKVNFIPMDRRAPIFSVNLAESPNAPSDLVTNFAKYENTYFVTKVCGMNELCGVQ
jgi:hypothetical protein